MEINLTSEDYTKGRKEIVFCPICGKQFPVCSSSGGYCFNTPKCNGIKVETASNRLIEALLKVEKELNVNSSER